MRSGHVKSSGGVKAAFAKPAVSDAAGGGHPKPSRRYLRPAAMIGTAPALDIVFEQIAQVAPSTTTVLLRGESGTGKELVAGAIHDAGPRASGPFVSINCAAIPESLIESELFGHERGAFTGAVAVRKGRFELAQGGTLFLDEVGDLSLLTQAKLLRVIQERTFERLGGLTVHKADARIIAATNKGLEEMVEQGLFRRDLYYRLNVFPIHLPPLRERLHDILPLADHFVKRFAAKHNKNNVRMSPALSPLLYAHTWPGNIRELENVMERAVLLVNPDGCVMPEHLPLDIQRAGRGPAGLPPTPGPAGGVAAGDEGGPTLQGKLDRLELSCIVEALENERGHIRRAAASLGLTERVMSLRMAKYNLTYKDYRQKQ
ncbi:MAG: sigma 54-interacting transcriptional regulator [Desulfovibrio sp.]|jgi:Nif-specific regulatory protein|nr:sigma 54-interacting transcriptional regulator [Desulfovibrio sp.]